MEEREDNEKTISKLIKKRKEENEAFMKLLNAVENKGPLPVEEKKVKTKKKSKL
jgi:hypothetical protein